MPGIHDPWLFVLAAILLILTPGQDTLYIVGRSLAQGRAAGLASALGIAAGTVVHTIAAAVGLSAVLAASATAFFIVKVVGASYLVYLGARMLISGRAHTIVPTPIASPRAMPSGCGAPQPAPRAAGRSFWPIFRQGALTNILNPKVALFFLAFMPQFIVPGTAHRFAAFLILGCTFIAMGLAWCCIVAITAASMSARLQPGSKAGDILNRSAGALFVGLGVKLALSK
jgi:threonine/homoserine/homoserine lactone efflux protein